MAESYDRHWLATELRSFHAGALRGQVIADWLRSAMSPHSWIPASARSLAALVAAASASGPTAVWCPLSALVPSTGRQSVCGCAFLAARCKVSAFRHQCMGFVGTSLQADAR